MSRSFGARTPTPETTQTYTQAELDASPYLKSVVTREGDDGRHQRVQEGGPYKIALAAQGPTNSWAALFDEEARYHVDQLGKDKVSDLLYADANGSADKQVPEVEDLLSQNPDALILVPMGRAALPPRLIAPRRRACRWCCAPAASIATATSPKSAPTSIDLGARLATWLVDQLGGTGKIVVMDGIPGVDTAEIAKTGAASVWAENPGIKILDEQYGQWSTSEAKKVAESGSPSTARTSRAYGRTAARCRRASSKPSRKPSCRFRRLPAPTYSNGFLRQVRTTTSTSTPASTQCHGDPLHRHRASRFFRASLCRASSTSATRWRRRRTSTMANIDQFYNPKWSDDVFPPIFLPDSKMIELKYMKP